MIKGTTKTGFNYEINQKMLENYELVEKLGKLEKNPLILPEILEMILGEQVPLLKEHVRDKDGIVNITDINNEIADIFANSNQLKN